MNIRMAQEVNLTADRVLGKPIDVIVSLSPAEIEKSWEVMEPILDEEIVAHFGYEMTDVKLRMMCALFCHVTGWLPMLTWDFTEWLLQTGCQNTVRHVVDEFFQKVAEPAKRSRKRTNKSKTD